MSDRDRGAINGDGLSAGASPGRPAGDRVPDRVPGRMPATAASCHPDVVCPVCTAKGKTVRMVPIKAHYQCPDCRYFDSCCM